MSYNFAQLNDKEFEILVVDLLSAFLGCRIERFKPGRDGGVDGRFFSIDGENILQCKHYLKTGHAGLISKLRKEEAPKVKKLNPEKYFFATSLPLSRINKEEIKNIFHPYIKESSDVYGQEDLNGFLFDYPKIEEKHFKLWLASTNVLSRIINNAIKGRSEFELERIMKQSYRYIQTKNHYKALEILTNKRVLIISGEPGIGKTTLAENMCLYFTSKDFEFIDIEESLSEAEGIFTKGEKQIYYFDDFLGSTYLEAIENKKDSHIVKFIERVLSDKTKLFILTSRTNILDGGIYHSSSFANSNIQKKEFMLTFDSLSMMDKAKILYNHIWFSNISEEFIDEIYKDKRYIKIIKHANFNPRLIEFITDCERISTSNCLEYWDYIEKTLSNPKEIWSDYFNNQSNGYVRNLVLLTVFNRRAITEVELRKSYDILNEFEKLKNSSHTNKGFDAMSRLATRAFFVRDKNQTQVLYTLFNPSVADFVLGEYAKNVGKLINIFKSLETIKSLKQLSSLKEEKIISQEDFVEIKKNIFHDAFDRKKSENYLVYISDMLPVGIDEVSQIITFLKSIINEPCEIAEFSSLLNLLLIYEDKLKIKNYDFLSVCIGRKKLDEYEIESFAEFISILDIENEEVLSNFQASLEDFLVKDLNDSKNEIDLSKIVELSKSEEDELAIDYDIEKIDNELQGLVNLRIKDFQSDFIDNLDIDISKNILSQISVDSMIDNHIESQQDMDYDDYRENSYYSEKDNSDNAIDDLFNRS